MRLLYKTRKMYHKSLINASERVRNASEMLQKCFRKVRPKSEHSVNKV